MTATTTDNSIHPGASLSADEIIGISFEGVGSLMFTMWRVSHMVKAREIKGMSPDEMQNLARDILEWFLDAHTDVSIPDVMSDLAITSEPGATTTSRVRTDTIEGIRMAIWNHATALSAQRNS